MTLLASSNAPASAMTNFNSRQASFIIDTWPMNDFESWLVAPTAVVVPSRHISLMRFLVSSAETLTPDWKPRKAETPRSLNRSAEAIPALMARCNCMAVSSKARPETAAMSPVIANKLFNSSTLSATVRSEGEARSISSRENGTLAANLFIVSNALAASSVEPVRNFNLICRLSTSEATVMIDLIAAPAPRPSRAPWSENTALFTAPKPFWTPVSADLVLSTALMTILTFSFAIL